LTSVNQCVKSLFDLNPGLLKEFILNTFLLIFLLELGAAIAGSYYLKYAENPGFPERMMVKYLWLVIFVEIVGLYPAINYFTDFRAFPFVKDTIIVRNFWWYNSYAIIKILVLCYYFILQLTSRRTRKILVGLIIVYTLGGILNIFTKEFFEANSPYLSIGGTFILTIIILLYYLEILKSNRILHFYRIPAFYFSMGLLIWHLIVTPLLIYSYYFTLKSPEFVALHSNILRLANVLLYSLFILGWVVSMKYKKDDEEVPVEIGSKTMKNKKVSFSSKY
jgi:hypothetical protein